MQTLQMVATAQDDVILELQTMIKNFLQSKPNAVINKMQTQAETDGANQGKRQAGILAGFTADPAFYEPMKDEEIAKW